MQEHHKSPRKPRARSPRGVVRSALSTIVFMFLVAWWRAAGASPEAHLLRIDPRTSRESGDPIVTTVVELVQSKRVSEATASCSSLKGDAGLDCMSEALGKPNALYQAFPFPKDNALFTVEVDGSDVPAKLVSQANWGDSAREPGVGTAWLLLVDADGRMGAAFEDAKVVAERFIASLGPHDIVDVMLFNDRQVVLDSTWLGAGNQAKALATLRSAARTYPSQGRSRPLLSIIQSAATDAFKALGNTGSGVTVPMHQALVVLSTGYGGADPKTTGPGALQLRQYMSNGRFPEDNTALPKTPVPVISIYIPPRTWDELQQNALEFMRDLANPEIGGYFSVLRAGRGGRGDEIVRAVRTRFSKMHLVKWRLSCVAPTITQSFKLVFDRVEPPIAGDTTFRNVPLGIDPSSWPLDVDVKYTQAQLVDGVYPGGRFKVYGNFCWGGEKSRAEVYFLPAGQQPPSGLSAGDLAQAREAQKRLIATGMRGMVTEVGDTFAEFEAPDQDKIVHGAGASAVVRAVIYDNKARRTSGVTAGTMLELRATSAPFPAVLVLAALAGAGLLGLVIVLLLRSSSKRSRRGPRVPPSAPAWQRSLSATGQPRGASPTPDQHRGPVQSVVLEGKPGNFTITTGPEVRVGRDSSQCAVLLNESQVSGVHASLKLEGDQFLLRDEQSNNGTVVDGARIEPGRWVSVGSGSRIQFGPVEFRVLFN